MREQRLIAVSKGEIETNPFKALADFEVIDRVIAIFVMKPALPEDVLGDEQDVEP